MYWIEVHVTHRNDIEVTTYEVNQVTQHRDPLPGPVAQRIDEIADSVDDTACEAEEA